ncbi:hypothetical protein RvY_13861 [Ramazzottius varieornatus]|uniref:DDHD domain-containing protein n=1 Tax=Ramazzottius varieornatus TaxID=947166 RepID=A0A1D1VUJ5_RAMVA|nr:hypothetical protein RvY_13861 [Ramazzottius varieornatus]
MEPVWPSKVSTEDDDVPPSGRPRLMRRTSSLLDCMKYSMSMAHEVPLDNLRKKYSSEEAWKTGGQVPAARLSRKASFAEGVEDASSVDSELASRFQQLTRMRNAEFRRTRYDSAPASIASGLGLYRSSSWVSSMGDASMDQGSFDNVDGLLSRAGTLPYVPVLAHWFFIRKDNSKETWVPFTLHDSKELEEGWDRYRRGEKSFAFIPTQGGRYDVDLKGRKLVAVYWEEEPFPVRRATWFWKVTGDLWIPYEETIADKLEGEYKLICRTGQWQKRIDLPGGETIILHSETAMIHYDATKSWADVAETLYKNQKIVKRGWEGTCTPDEGEWEPVDHLVFVSHGIGSYCDLRWRTLNQCVDAYRLMSRNLLREHFNFAGKKGKTFRVEFIPINWHGILHSDNVELENRIKRITLPSIPIVRYFANDYVLDILFYSSPMFCTVIANHVGTVMNRVYSLFQKRNPNFKGSVSILAHSLGSIVMFDMLSHQPDANPENERKNPMEASFSTMSNILDVPGELRTPVSGISLVDPDARPGYSRQGSSAQVTADYIVPPFGGAGYPSVRYPVLKFKPSGFFAIGSPVGMFLAVRGVTNIAEDYYLPTCPRVYNIFHPTDPVAYRIEPLLIPEACKVPPSMIDHHKGRKRLHLEVQRNIASVASTLKTRLLDPVRMLSSMVGIPDFASRFRAKAQDEKQEGVNATTPTEEKVRGERSSEFGPAAPTPSTSTRNSSDGQMPKIKSFGMLNGGERIDYVLQEAPLESLNQYLFALHSHAVYWDSEDTLLFMLRKIIEVERDNITASTEEEENEPYI